jgi:hypothetical protein
MFILRRHFLETFKFNIMIRLFTKTVSFLLVVLLCVWTLNAQNYNVFLGSMPVMGGVVTGEGVYEQGTSVTITATPHEFFEFEKWVAGDGEVISYEPEYHFTINGDINLFAYFVITTTPFEIVVSGNPLEGGTVSGGGFFTLGTDVMVSAEPYPNFLFLNWTENGNMVSTEVNYSFPMYGPRSLVANFVPSTVEIILSKNIEEGGTVIGGGIYPYGQTVLIYATDIHPEYMFDNWTENGNLVTWSHVYAFTATQSRHLVANFTPAFYEIPVYANPYEGGTVTGGGTYTHGSHVTISAAANSGYQFSNWTRYISGSGTVVSTEPVYTYEVIGDGWGNTAFIAYFEEEGEKVITILTNIPGGEVLGGGTYQYGDEVTLKAIPKPGFKFVNWVAESKSIVSTENPYSFTVTESLLLIANFEEDGMMNIESIDTESILIYPNPTTGELRVESGELKVNSVEIFDVHGKKILNIMPQLSNSISINTFDFPAGVYFIQLLTEQGTVTKKFVKN